MTDITPDFLKSRPLSQSSLKEFKKSPLHYIAYLEDKKEYNPAYVIGGAIDCLIFTPEDFNKRYIVNAECDRRTKEGKAIYEEFLKDADGKEILKKEDFEMCVAMKHSFFMNPLANKLFERCDNLQTKMNWIDKETKLPMVTIADATGEGIILSLKTSQSANPDSFSADASKYNYFLQCGIEMEAMARKGKFPDYYYAVIEKSGRYPITIMKASDDFINYGKKLFRNLLENFNMCMQQKRFHEGYEFWSIVGYHTLELPFWAKKKLEETI